MSKRFARFPVMLTFTVMLALAALVLPAFAGGWAVVTLDRLPEQVIAGESVTVGFVVRQHGITPMGGLSPSVRLQKEGESPSWISAKPQGAEGHYAAAVTFPTAGVWNWSIDSDFWPETQPMPALTVLAGGGTAAGSNSAARSPWPLVIGIAGLVAVVGGGLAYVRLRAPWAAAVTLAAAVISVVGFTSMTMRATASTSPKVVAPQSQAELGERLFIAKGCVVCHTHDAVSEVKRAIPFNLDEAPDLTDYSAAPDYLAKWLDDPASIKPKTYMPKLDLSDDEIGALVAFINAP